jgi:hypothetical protein
VQEIASEKNSTTIFPIPIDLFKGLFDAIKGGRAPALPAKASGESVPPAQQPSKDRVQA